VLGSLLLLPTDNLMLNPEVQNMFCCAALTIEILELDQVCLLWDQCYDFLNIFAEKFSKHIGGFCSNYS
jgi:hypothetical protein